MHINHLGYHFRHDKDFEISRPQGSRDYILLLFNTRAGLSIEDQKYTAPSNSLILYKPGTLQYYCAVDDIYIDDFVNFDMSDEECAALQAMHIPLDTIVQLGDITPLSQIIKAMYQERYSANIYKEETLYLYFKMLFFKISERIQYVNLTQASPHYDKMSLVRTQIYNKPAQSWSIKDLARELSLSESYFQHLYKQFFGVSAISDVITSRIEHGKYLLAGTFYSVNQVSKECGYKNDVQFMRQFKTVTGLTPSEYRKQFKISGRDEKLSCSGMPIKY